MMIQKYLRVCVLAVLVLALSTTGASATKLRVRALQEATEEETKKPSFFDGLAVWVTSFWSFLDFSNGSDEEGDRQDPSLPLDTILPELPEEATAVPSIDASIVSSIDASALSSFETSQAGTEASA